MWTARIGVIIAIVLVEVCHVWLVSAGYWTQWPSYSDRYDRLADAFAHGQTHLMIPADPGLLALTDPYDPVANERFRKQPGVHDACLYNGRLYYYWGPTSALLLAPGKLLVGNRIRVGDEQLCFAFALGIIAVTGRTLLRVQAECYPRSPRWLPALGVLLAGLSAPITCIMTRAAVYEVAILGGQCFLIGGIYLAWRAIACSDQDRTASGDGSQEMTSTRSLGPACRRLLLAGTFLSAAVGSRISLAVAVSVIGFMVVGIVVWRRRRRVLTSIVPVLCFGLPLLVSAIGLCAYNVARFDRPLEFGQRYQLAGANLLALPRLFGIDFLWPNLWSYFVRPIAWLTRFPFAMANTGYDHFPAFIRLPQGYEIYEPITGLPWVMPILVAIVVAFRSPSRLLARSGTVASTDKSDADARRTPSLVILVTLLLIAAIFGFAPVLLMIGSSQRYLADFAPPLVVVAMIAVWRLTDRRNVAARIGRIRLTFYTTLSAVTVIIGLLVSIEGYSAHFRIHNPSLYQTLKNFGSEDSTHE